MEEYFKYLSDWCNQNSGLLTLIIFLLTLIIGWISGLFRLIRKRPNFIILVIEGMTFGSTFDLQKTYNGLPVHKTAFSIYLKITNTGNAPSSIGDIFLGYKRNDLSLSWKPKWNWIRETIAKSDFSIGFEDSEQIKGFPFLKQKNIQFPNEIDLYLEVGKIVNGISYFEEQEAYGSWMPKLNKGQETTDIKIKIYDSFGGIHRTKFTIKMIDPNEALKKNPFFGQTYKEYFISKTNNEDNIKNK